MPPHLTPSFALPARNRCVRLVRRPNGVPQADDFAICDTERPVPGDGQILVRNIYLSVDPAQRGWAADASNYVSPVPLGETMRALAVGQVVASRLAGYDEGDFVYGWLGWQDYAVIDAGQVLTHFRQPLLPLSAHAGILGINGLTASLALARLGRPQPGETVAVSTAAGAVGSVVGQLSRAAGARTIGLAGDQAKIDRCLARYGYDVATDYKRTDLAQTLRSVAADGLDVYFDNVGGQILDTMLRSMRVGGRIVQCGTASIAAWSPEPVGPRAEREVLTRRLTWAGFVIFDHVARFMAEMETLAAAVRSGSLVYDEDIADGIESAPGSIRQLYSGENAGKKLIFIG